MGEGSRDQSDQLLVLPPIQCGRYLLRRTAPAADAYTRIGSGAQPGGRSGRGGGGGRGK